MDAKNVFYKKLTLVQSCIDRLNLADKKKLEILEREYFLSSIGSNEQFVFVCTKHALVERLNALACKLTETKQAEYAKYVPEKFDNERKLMCPSCKISLVTYSTNLLCDVCGYNIPLSCSVYDEFLFKKTTKKKDYKRSEFCQKWLDLVQGKLNIVLPDTLKESLKNEASKIYLADINCVMVRKWLRTHGAPQFNKFTSNIIREVTRELGDEIIPTQFDNEEEHQIIMDFCNLSDTYCSEYNKLKEKEGKKNNSPYYPIFIYFIVKERWPYKAVELDRYIYKQSVDTYNFRQLCWEYTKEKTGYKF